MNRHAGLDDPAPPRVSRAPRRRHCFRRGSRGALAWAALALAACVRRPPGPGAIAAREHAVVREGIRLALWEKHAVPVAEAARASRVLLLVHGATYSGRPDFDLPVRDYSLMDFFARHGYDVWALDIHGYGHSARPAGDWSDTASAVRDIEAAVEWIAHARDVSRLHVLGWSWGTQTTGRFAALHPERVNRLVLFAPFWHGRPEWRTARVPTEATHSNVPPDLSDFIPGQAEPDVVAAYGQAIVRTDPRSPNGVWVDLYTKLPLLEPERIRAPTLVIHGERDPIAQPQDLLPFFAALGTHDKQYVMLPDGGHAIMLEAGRARFQQTVLAFLERP
jgi:pimeloyl-ACP methyl ester carboxylesterase